MSDSIHLGMPYIAASQAQKHVTHNEALRLLDCIVMLSVKDRDLSAPPGSPADGDRYVVAASGSGAWAGKDARIAEYRDGAWVFHVPRAGWTAFVEDEAVAIVFNGSGWTANTAIAGSLVVGGRLGVQTGAITPLHDLYVASSSSAGSRGLAVGQHAGGTSAGLMNFYRSRGTLAAPEQISENDAIGTFFARPYVNGDYRIMAGFGFAQNGTISGSNAPTDIIFAPAATVLGGLTAGEKFRFAAAGDLKMGGSGGTIVITAERHPQLRSYTVGTLPSAATAGQLIYVSNGNANRRLAVSDGTNWRFPDGNVVS